MKPCSKCGQPKRLEEYHRDSTKSDGRKTVCRECCHQRDRNYQSRPEVRIRNAVQRRNRHVLHREEDKVRRKAYYSAHAAQEREAAREHARRYPERAKARRAVHRALKQGILKKRSCEVCRAEKTEAHHHKGYAPENWLDVVWLCRSCHMIEHRGIENEEMETK